MKNTYTGYQYAILDVNDFIIDRGIVVDATLDDNHTFHIHGWSVKNESILTSYHIGRNYEGKIYLYAPSNTYPPAPKRTQHGEIVECL